MISNELDDILTAIHTKKNYMNNMSTCAQTHRIHEADARKQAEMYEKCVNDTEVEIDALQIDLKRVLNGQPAETPVLATGVDEQVGREA